MLGYIVALLFFCESARKAHARTLHGEEVGVLGAALLLEELVAPLEEVLGALLLWVVRVCR
jgi:hypothetical protein